MKVYVAGRTSDIERVNRVQQWIRDAGHEISFDWTEDPASGIRHDWSDAVPQARGRALTELTAIHNSDALVLCWKDGSCGALLETGMAMATMHTTIVVSGATRESVFFYLPAVVRVDDDSAIVAALEDWHSQRGVLT